MPESAGDTSLWLQVRIGFRWRPLWTAIVPCREKITGIFKAGSINNLKAWLGSGRSPELLLVCNKLHSQSILRGIM